MNTEISNTEPLLLEEIQVRVLQTCGHNIFLSADQKRYPDLCLKTVNIYINIEYIYLH